MCNATDGFLFKLELDMTDLEVLDFDTCDPLVWIAELMSHRDADASARYRRFAPLFIKKYGIDTAGYDVIKGWRADLSYFLIAKRFVRDELDAALLKDALRLGDLGIQYCIKSKRAFDALEQFCEPIERVNKDVYLEKFNSRDNNARRALYELIDSDRNTMKDTFSSYI